MRQPKKIALLVIFLFTFGFCASTYADDGNVVYASSTWQSSYDTTDTTDPAVAADRIGAPTSNIDTTDPAVAADANGDDVAFVGVGNNTYAYVDSNDMGPAQYSISTSSTQNSYIEDNEDFVQPKQQVRSGGKSHQPVDVSSRVAQHITPMGEDVVIVDPRLHTWAAYDAHGNLVRSGQATAGKHYCPDTGQTCRTKVGTFRIKSLGGPGCVSSKFPIPRGGAPMPYCMFFHGGQALHGAAPHNVRDANLSHGCVRLHTPDAEWLRYHFVTVGTLVIIKPY